MTITLYSHSMKYYNCFLLSGRRCLPVKITRTLYHFNEFLVDLMVTVLLRRNLAGLLHFTDAKKPNETNKTVVLLQICVEKITKATKLLCSIVLSLNN